MQQMVIFNEPVNRQAHLGGRQLWKYTFIIHEIIRGVLIIVPEMSGQGTYISSHTQASSWTFDFRFAYLLYCTKEDFQNTFVNEQFGTMLNIWSVQLDCETKNNEIGNKSYKWCDSMCRLRKYYVLNPMSQFCSRFHIITCTIT